MDYNHKISELRNVLRSMGSGSSDERLEAAKNRYRLAEYLRAEEKYGESIAEAKAALRACKEFPDEHLLAASAHHCLALALWQGSDLGGYRAHCEKALKRIRKLDDPENTLTLLMQVGLARHNAELLSAAIKAYQEALGVIARLTAGNADTADARATRAWAAECEITVTRRLANFYLDYGDLDRARALYETCRPSTTTSNDDRLSWHNGRAVLAERMDDERIANEHYCRAARLTARVSRNPRTFTALSNAAMWFYTNGATRIGDALRRRCLELARDRSARTDALDLAILDAVIADIENRLEDAIGHLRAAEAEAEAKSKELTPNLVAERAALLARLSRWEEARDALRPLVRVPVDHRNRHGLTAAIALGSLLSNPDGAPTPEDIEESERVLRAAFLAEFRRGSVAGQWRLLSALADMAAARGRDHAAVLLGKAATADIRRGGTTAETAHGRRNRERLVPLRRLADRLADATCYPQAAEVKRIYQQEEAYDILRRDRSHDPRTIDVSLTDEEKPLLAELARIRESLIELQHDVDAADPIPFDDAAGRQAELSAWLDRVLAQEWCRPSAAPPAPIAHAVPKGCVHIDFLHGSAGWTVYARTSDMALHHALTVDPKELARTIFAFRETISGTSREWLAQAKHLYDVILRPIELLLGESGRLSFSLAGPFASLPFAALHDGKRYLIERFAISVRTGIRPAERPAQQSKPHVLLFGPQSSGSETSESMTPFGSELSQIASIYEDAHWPSAFTATSLTEALRLRPHIAHIASHFHFQPGMPGRSWFELEDGERLTVSRFREPDFDLSSLDLLVLAACNSALADSSSTMLESMAAVAQCRGARCVLGTLWPVADRSVSLLMTDFYGRLRTAPELNVESIGQALQNAQLAMATPDANDIVRSFWAHPSHWAGLVLFEPEPGD